MNFLSKKMQPSGYQLNSNNMNQKNNYNIINKETDTLTKSKENIFKRKVIKKSPKAPVNGILKGANNVG